MNYLLLALLLWPWLRLWRCLRPVRPGTRLVIQTAKIGDWINTSPVLRGLGPVDVVCAPEVMPLACHDTYIQTRHVLPARAHTLEKLRLAWRLFHAGYAQIYVLMPNLPNTFLARLACAATTHTLDTYKTGRKVRLLGAGFRRQRHGREELALDNYLRLAGLPCDAPARKKHATHPLFVPHTSSLVFAPTFRVGISLSAGNRMKTLPLATWEHLLALLAPLAPRVYVFGLPDEQPLFDKLRARLDTQSPILENCLGRIPLEALPWHLAHMHLYISTDTGNSYIADSLDVPLISFIGPCCMAEQRPLGARALVVATPGLAPFSYVFDTVYSPASTAPALYAIDSAAAERIACFMQDCHTAAQARHWS